MRELIESVKKNEGFSQKPYVDVLVKKNPEKYGISKAELAIIEKHLDKLKLTFGHGLTFIESDESEAVVSMRIKKIIKEIEKREPFINKLPLEKQEIIAEMSYQLGVSGVLRFRKMWAALREFDYKRASAEMLDSTWAVQTPNRAKELARKMGGAK